jgi:diguanylate cyclase (GGDEF)-like protein
MAMMFGEALIKSQLARLRGLAFIESDERRLAGSISGVLYMMGGVIVLPSLSHDQRGPLLVVAGVAVGWGACSLILIDWGRVPQWLIHASSTAGFALIAAAIALSGGATSPAWIYLFFIAVFVAYFYRRPVALLYLFGCVVTHGLAIFYDPRVGHTAFIAQFVIGSGAYVALGGAVISGKTLLWKLNSRAERLAAEQASLLRVTTAVVEGKTPASIYELVAREAAVLLDGGVAMVLRTDAPGEATVMGSWSDRAGGGYERGMVVPIQSGGDVAQALSRNAPVHAEHHFPDSLLGRLGYSSSIVVPIRVAGSMWGAIAVAAAEVGRLTDDDEQRLIEFSHLLATAIAIIEDRARLAAQASSDPMTGLANHRTLQQRLAEETARAVRHSSPLSVAVIDIDNFKQVNDIGGHEAGDEMLGRVARCLTRLARAEDTLGRVGGDEFAWVLPETTREEALVAVERARHTIAADARQPYRVTVSAGICDTTTSTDAAELIRLADGALYWSKAHGRDQCWIYDPQVIHELSAQDRRERLERSHALLGLRALARAIDAKDPATRQHSERVAELVGKLARVVGWPHERAVLLSEAALVHDVGKVGVPDAVLGKVGPLDAAERKQIEAHAELSARIVDGVLAAEQVEWIRTHHERPDGGGYPRGLTSEELSEGAALLSVADAFDAMTVSRSHSPVKSFDVALEECQQLVGAQFTEDAVAALLKLHAGGELSPSLPPPGLTISVRPTLATT